VMLGQPVRPSLIVLSRDEEANLSACLQSVSSLGCPIYVVDSGSTDRTVEIARATGAVIFEHPFESHTKQWSWALANVPGEVEWVLGLDADQQLSPELSSEIARLFGEETSRLQAFDGFYLNRRQIFRGRWIRHGGYYPKYLLKLFRRSKVSLNEHDLVDHHFYVSGRTDRLRGDLIELNRKEDEIAFWIAKHNRYARFQAVEEAQLRRGVPSWPIQPAVFGDPDQRVLWLKERWRHLPLYWRPFLYFIYRYLMQLGLLDGKEGFVFHFLHAFWYRLLVDINLDEILGKPTSTQKSTGSLLRS
jgi:glycosyltransferase involved in cell wall biosynthesis